VAGSGYLAGGHVPLRRTRDQGDHPGWLYGGARQTLLGGAAAAITYAFGSLVGAGLS
jgi:hypothetical protein